MHRMVETEVGGLGHLGTWDAISRRFFYAAACATKKRKLGDHRN